MSDRAVVLYRIIRSASPTIDDMRSHIELGIKLRRTDSESLRMARGISFFDTIERARNQARRKPWLGNAFIAETESPLDRVRIEKTAGPGHYTAWAEASDMLEYVRCVERA